MYTNLPYRGVVDSAPLGPSRRFLNCPEVGSHQPLRAAVPSGRDSHVDVPQTNSSSQNAAQSSPIGGERHEVEEVRE